MQFFVDGSSVLFLDGANAEYWIFKGSVDGIEAGPAPGLGARQLRRPRAVLDSVPAFVTIAAAARMRGP